MKIGFIQTSPTFGQVEHNVSRALDVIDSIETDLVVLPELFSTGYLFPNRRSLSELAEPVPDGPTCQKMSQAARSTGTAIVFGIAEKSGDKLFNSAVYVNPSGECSTYRKLHLFGSEKSYFNRGDLPLKVYDLGEYKLGIMICFDWIFPEVCRILALKGAHIVCHPSNLVTQYCQEAMRTRSIENRIFTVTANRIGSDSTGDKTVDFTGCSQIVGVDGKVLARAGESNESSCVLDVDMALAESKYFTEENDIFVDRRPEFYRGIISA